MESSTACLAFLSPFKNFGEINFSRIAHSRSHGEVAPDSRIDWRRPAPSSRDQNGKVKILLPRAQLGHLALQIRGYAFENSHALFAALQGRFKLGHLAQQAIVLALDQLHAFGRNAVEAVTAIRAVSARAVLTGRMRARP